VEVYCEFVFEPPEGQTWDWLRICEFAKEIDGDFPQHRMVRQHGEPARLGADENEAYWEEGDADQPAPLFRFATKDGLTTVQIGENLLVVNGLPVENPRPPYGAWKKFYPYVHRSISTYRDVWKPERISQLFLHYVDRIFIPKNDFEFRDYFNLSPVLPADLDNAFTNLSISCDLKGAGKGDVLSLVFQEVFSPDPDRVCYLVNWDYWTAESVALDAKMTGVKDWLEAGVKCCGSHFKSLYTDRCLKLFESDGNS